MQRIAADATLRLTVQQQLPFGENLRVAGSGDALGNWDPASAPSETPLCCHLTKYYCSREPKVFDAGIGLTACLDATLLLADPLLRGPESWASVQTSCERIRPACG